MWFLPRSRVFWLAVGIIVGGWARDAYMGWAGIRLMFAVGLLTWVAVFLAFHGRRIVRSLAESLLYAPMCPTCGRHALMRKAVVSFGSRYYACSECTSRWKRRAFGLWEPAVGKGDAAVYAPTQRSPFDENERWSEEETDNGWKSIDNLVRKHRQRQDIS